MTPADVLTVAGSADNVFRTLQTLPGVAGVEEFGSRLAVRGGGPDQNLTVMDGVEIHNPYRLFGLTSAFNPETIRTFELSTGAFAARYGDRLSSLLVVENRDGDDTQKVQRNVVAQHHGRQRHRRGQAPRQREGLVAGDGPPHLLRPGRERDRGHRASVLQRSPGADELGAAARSTAHRLCPAQPRVGRRQLRGRPRRASTATFVTAARNDVVALRFDSTLGARGSSRTSLSWYRNTDALDVGAVFRDPARRSNSASDGVGFADTEVAFTRDLTVRDVALRQDFAFGASGRHLIEGGFEAHALDTAVGWLITGDRNPNEANGSSVRGGAGLPSVLDSSRDSVRAGAYVQDRFQMTPRLVVEPGLRLDVSGINDQTTLSPRLRATLSLGDDTRLVAGTGLFTQSPGYEKLVQSDYFLDLSTADAGSLDSERSVHAVLGLERDLAPGLLARVEGYYKSFDRLIVGRLETEAERLARVARYDFPPELQSSIPTSAQITTEPINGATGRAYGFDLYVARRAVSADTRLTGWASYTYGRATRDVYERRFPFEYDRAARFIGGGRLAPRTQGGGVRHGPLRLGFPVHADRRPAGVRGGRRPGRRPRPQPHRDRARARRHLPARLHPRPRRAGQPSLRAAAGLCARRRARRVPAEGSERAVALLPRRDQRARPRERRRVRGVPRVQPGRGPAAPRARADGRASRSCRRSGSASGSRVLPSSMDPL